MAVQGGGRAPYASTGSIKTVIEKHRQVGLQTISLQKLQQIGVTEALAPRTLHSLILLDFYDENGDVTPEFDALRKATEHDFKPRLAALLRAAYAPILDILDPAVATPLDVENAFRGYEPTGQLPRMVQLFMGLMAYAELMPEQQRRRKAVAKAAPKPKQPNSGQGATARGSEDSLAPKPPRQEREAAEQRHVSLGTAGSVTVIVDVRWLDLPEDQFTKLRKLIKDIEALGLSGTGSAEAEEVSV